MTSKIRTIILLLFAAISLFLLFSFFQPHRISPSKTISVNGHKFNIQVADDKNERAHGLSGTDQLGENEGMLFVFPAAGKYFFWMKDMKLPLDFIWINGNAVIETTENVPQPASGNQQLDTFSAKEPFDKVLEVNAGTVKRFSIKTGDIVVYE